ncbi:hypothetical protein BC835DRAFT_1421341 [Cytidiella melzeri]|nr:hypothetical protein BC835DRAFT_1421341 [Cytidiella melzeri]
MKYTFALVSALLLAGEATASTVRINRSFKQMIQARQGSVIDPSDIAPQCQTICAPMVSAFNNCTNDACLCTNSVIKATASCLDCNLAVDGPPTPSLVTQAQQALEGIEDACAAAGDSVTSLTVSGFTGGASTVVTSSGSGATVTATIPVVTSNTLSPSIFFSGTGASASSPSTSVIPISQMSIPAQPSHITISGSQSPSTSPVVGFSSTGSLSGVSMGSAPTPTSGAGGTTSGGVFKLEKTSSLALAGVVGGAMLLMAF